MGAKVALRMFHGRDDPDQEMDDWGYDGPVLGPLAYVHVTYGSHVKFAMEKSAFDAAFTATANKLANEVGDYWYVEDGVQWVCHELFVVNDLLVHNGQYYGDWSISGYDE